MTDGAADNRKIMESFEKNAATMNEKLTERIDGVNIRLTHTLQMNEEIIYIHINS